MKKISNKTLIDYVKLQVLLFVSKLYIYNTHNIIYMYMYVYICMYIYVCMYVITYVL